MTRIFRRALPKCLLLCSTALSAGASAAQEPGAAATPEFPSRAEQRRAGEAFLRQAATAASLDDLDAAEDGYLQAIEQLSSADGEFSSRLIEAYRGLADVFVGRGEYAEALAALEQARHISHRNFGLFNLAQGEVLDDITDVHEAAGDTRQAQAAQREMLKVAVRHFGGEKRGVIPYHLRLAEYYDLSRMRAHAREHYLAVLDILDADPDASVAERLEPLSELVRIDIVTGEQSAARRELLATLEASGGAQPQARSSALAVLGDGALAANDIEQAFHYYRDAFSVLQRISAEAAAEFFASPRMVNFVPPASPVDLSRSEDDYAWGHITARFAVSAEGRAEQVVITSAAPQGLMDAAYRRRLTAAVFRPRLVAGEPVRTREVRFNHEFRYFVDGED